MPDGRTSTAAWATRKNFKYMPAEAGEPKRK